MTTEKNGFLPKELKGYRLFVGLQGAELRCVSADGEVRWELAQLPGRYFSDEYTSYMQSTDRLEVQGGVFVKPRGGALGRMQPMGYGEQAYRSGANPNWKAPVRTAEQERASIVSVVRKQLTRDFERREAKLVARLQAKMAQPSVIEEEPKNETQEAPGGEKDVQQAPPKAGGDEAGQVQLPKGEKEVNTDD